MAKKERDPADIYVDVEHPKPATNKLMPLTGDCYEECPDEEAP